MRGSMYELRCLVCGRVAAGDGAAPATCASCGAPLPALEAPSPAPVALAGEGSATSDSAAPEAVAIEVIEVLTPNPVDPAAAVAGAPPKGTPPGLGGHHP